MKLKQNKNIKLLQSCSHVRVIELKEQLSNLDKKQFVLVEKSPELKAFLKGVYQENNPEIQISNTKPSTDDLLKTDLSEYYDFEPDEDFAEKFREYKSLYRKIEGLSKTLKEHEDLNELLAENQVNLNKINSFLTKKRHTNSFNYFTHTMLKHSPIRISWAYRSRANEIAERNGFADQSFYSKSKNTFSLKYLCLKLNREFKDRLYSTGKKLALTAALSGTIIGATIGLTQCNSKHPEPEPEPIETTKPEEPTTAPEPRLTIFTNSVNNINSYETACKAYFEAISDVYYYNTGKKIDLSDYEQKDLGLTHSAQVLAVNYNGQTYRFSGKSEHASNYKYLKKAFDALGANYTEEISDIMYIINKKNPDQSLSIIDRNGNPVRSGKILSGSNSAYRLDYVQKGREILTQQGKDSSSLSEAECIAAYILSDEYNLQNTDLSIAQGELADSTSYIKNFFYYKSDNTQDTYAIHKFKNTFNKEKDSFDQSIFEVNPNTKTKSESEIDHDFR